MFYYIHNDQIAGYSDTEPIGVPDGYSYLESNLNLTPEEVYFDGGEVKVKPDRPSDSHQWAPTLNDWVLPPMPILPIQPNWLGLRDDLRQSSVWARVCSLAEQSLAVNVGFTLVAGALAAGDSAEALESAITILRAKLGDADFSDSELESLNDALEDNGFTFTLD